MDGLTVFFIFFFGIAALAPVLWSIGGLIRGTSGFWPTIVGAGWAVVLLLVTFVGIGTNWGGCPVYSGSSKDAVRCAIGDKETKCNPDVWKLECGGSSDDCPKPKPARSFCKSEGCPIIPPGKFCPAGQKPVFPFCEPIKTGGVKQPWATWSDLSFVAAGLWLLCFLHYSGRPGTSAFSKFVSADNPMMKIGSLSVTYGLIVIFMGPPSQWFHASLKDWGGWFDTMSVVMWMMFNAIYVTYALIFAMWGRGRERARTNTVLMGWGVLVIIFGIIAVNPDARTSLYFGAGVPWGLAEVIYFFVSFKSSVKYRRIWWLFLINLGLLGGTMVLWAFFNDNIASATACQGREGFPGHALFHILASFATILTFFSLASEQKPE